VINQTLLAYLFAAMRVRYLLAMFVLSFLSVDSAWSQCGGIMEPGFKFLTSSRGCAPYSVNLETLYLSSVPGTQYYVDWGDGTPEEVFTQVNASGVTVSHLYPNASVNCGYDLTIDASNACNPRGSVVPIVTQVIVWTNDVVSINPQEFRVCEGFASTLTFTDNSDWNCFPRATRENSDPRWIQWIYGTGVPANQISGIKVNGVTPGAFPYLNPAPSTNPFYPVTSPGQLSLSLQVPATTPADVGKDFVVTLKNWNQCNAYDNNLLDGNAFNPVSGDLVNGDNAPRVTTARIVIVPSPTPNYFTQLGNSGGPVQSVFCVGDNIYFNNQTPGIAGASFGYTWEFYDNNTGTGLPLSTSNNKNPTYSYPTAGQKLVRLIVKDNIAFGGCTKTYDGFVTISPSLVAKIATTDLLNNVITPDFCQSASAPFTSFQVRFNDASVGILSPTTEWRWEFFDQNNNLVNQVPAAGYSTTALGPFDESYINRGTYRARLTVRDNATGCQTQDSVFVHIYENPIPQFTAGGACQGIPIPFSDASTVNATNGESIVLREWDFNYNGVTFTKDAAFDNQTSFSTLLGVAGMYQVALRVTTDKNSCSAISVLPVTVDPLPVAQFTPDVTSGCSVLKVNFTNTSVGIQPSPIDKYVWEEDARDGLGFVTIGTQKPSDPGFTTVFTYQFTNTGTTNQQVDIRLHVFTANGCEKISSPTTITIFPGPISGFNSTNYSPFDTNCSPVSVNFLVDSKTQALNPSDYTWTITDQNGVISSTSTGTSPNFSFLFSNPTQNLKDFFVDLTTTLPSGCFNDSIRTIRIAPVPNSLFTIDTIEFDCQVLVLNLTASQKGLTSYHWLVIQDGIILTDITNTSDQMQFTFNRLAVDSNLQFSLDTKNLAMCSSIVTTASRIVPALDNMNVSFTADPLTQSLPGSAVTLTNTTNAGAWTYLWDFGDGITSTNREVGSHTYATYGTYTIKLTVSTKVCSQSQTTSIAIFAIPPQVDFQIDPATGCVPLTVQFTNLTKFADASSYQWDFGDGTTSQIANPSHSYVTNGTYTVTLSASNATGQTIKAVKSDAISVYLKPIAGFDFRPNLIYIPRDKLYTSNFSQGATSYLWNFGDGETSTEVRPEHVYKSEGVYTVTLIAKTENDCYDTLKSPVPVVVRTSGEILLPNAFSPGGADGSASGDGKNDVFLPVMSGVSEFELLIFNRWGDLLFKTTDQNTGWDGTYHGRPCQQDVYMYKLTAVLTDGQRMVRLGDVNLIR
jgi:gliding motility-associated-like protein